jgi:HD-GYP domain-containing protein (c-di-GMP phosphodiesterase class II)
MLEPRAHRPARSRDDAAAELRAEATAGRLDRDAVHANRAMASLFAMKHGLLPEEEPMKLQPR